jgi:hypothetical protein
MLNLGHKDAITPDLRERHTRHAIAGGPNLLDINRKIGPLLM